jgi:hypothetical protein
MDLLVLAIDQVGEADVVRLAASAVQQKLHQVGGAEERTRQMIQMHDCSNSRCHKYHPLTQPFDSKVFSPAMQFHPSPERFPVTRGVYN